jgi:hypothetical protein
MLRRIVTTQKRSRARERARGQVLVIFVGGFLALIAGTAFVVDGGNVMAQQRATQNGVDAVSEAGATVIMQYLMGGSSVTGAIGTCPTASADPWDLEVCKAVYGSAANNDVTVGNAIYVDFKGDAIPNSTTPRIVGAGLMPAGAQGVHAFASREFDTYFAGAIGIHSFTATTQATAVTNALGSLCVPGSPCGLFPITVPYEVANCDNNGMLHPGSGDWPFLGDDDTVQENMAIVPLCKDKDDNIGGGSAGSVGWLDYSTAIGGTTNGACANNFKNAIENPCITSLPFSTWVKTFTGGVGKGGPAIQTALNDYHGDIVQIPLFDGTCQDKPIGTDLADCTGRIGTGTNTWYHIPSFANFKLDYAYISGGDRKECEKPFGAPYVSGNGANGCIKGWWVVAVPGPGTINPGGVTPSTSNQLGVQLIK